MDMTLSKRGDYAMRSAISLARAFEEGVHRKIREVVAETEVPQTFAPQILTDLVRAGLAVSKAGRDGGYRLTRPPREISVLEVIEAAEGPLRAERCALGEGPCRWEAVCPVHETWAEATSGLRGLLSRTALAEVAARDAAIEAGTYAVPPDAHRSHPIAVGVSDVVQVELAAAMLHTAIVRVGGVLGAIVAAAAADGALGVAEGATPRSRRRPARVAEASLVPVGPNTPTAGPARYLLSWQLTSSGASSRLEAELSVVPVDVARSELRIEGTWRQGAAGALVAAPELELLARPTLRAFLRHLARALEEQPGSGRRHPSPRSMTSR
ncbi:MAG TPA: Rrf2 family transcriptional regulator [Acidimicrobiales bacterium]|nr:Rrf2 family transcriptional regulator [Acidimicrobiales bacterium]